MPCFPLSSKLMSRDFSARSLAGAFSHKGAYAMANSKQTVLLGLGLSFIYPFFWWTFFYVSSLSASALYEPTVPAFFLLGGALCSTAALAVWGNRAERLLAKAPWALPVLATASALSTLALFALIGTNPQAGLDEVGFAASCALAAVAGCGIGPLLFAWACALKSAQLPLRECAYALCGSLFLFFGYVLLFIGIPRFRFLLALGAIVSALLWTRFQRTAKPQPKQVAANASRKGLPKWTPTAISYLATSVIYWLVFSCDAAGAFPVSAFATLGNSPIADGQPFLYALFLLFLALLFVGFLSLKEERYPLFVNVLQTVLSALCIIACFSMLYLVPHYIDLAEGIICLLRADVQILLFCLLFMDVTQGEAPRLALILPAIDAVLMLVNSLVMGYAGLPAQSIGAGIGNVSFICGAVAVLLLAVASLALRSKAHSEKTAENAFDAALNAVASRYGLSEREREVLRFAARGYGAKGIAQNLNIAPSTAQTHLSRIYGKLDVHSKQELLDFMDEALKSMDQ